GAAGQTIVAKLARDELVSSMLLLYGLHPHDLETRVRSGLAKARQHLQRHGADVELVAVTDGIVRLRVLDGQSSSVSAATLRAAIERCVFDAAPDAVRLELDGLPEPPMPGLLQLGMPQRTPSALSVPHAHA